MKNDNGNAIPTIEKNFYLHNQKRHTSFKSPDINNMQVVVIDNRTKIYIALGADPEEARSRYLNRLEAKGKVHLASRKPVVS